jgi:hypothetical protein
LTASLVSGIALAVRACLSAAAALSFHRADADETRRRGETETVAAGRFAKCNNSARRRVVPMGAVCRGRPRHVFPQRPKRKFPRGLLCMHTGAGGVGTGGASLGGPTTSSPPSTVTWPLRRVVSPWAFIRVIVCVCAAESPPAILSTSNTVGTTHRGVWHTLAPHPARRQSCCAARGVALA